MTARWSLVVLGTLAAFAAVACGENGQTPSCPALSLYNINAAGAAGIGGAANVAGGPSDAKIAEERARAVDAGCMTDLLDASINDIPDAATKP